MNNKTQTEKLIEKMELGHSFTMLSALFVFGVQDLRKRLSDIRELGYTLHHGKAQQTITTGENVELLSWTIKNPLKGGDFVKVVAAPVLPCGTHPLRGKIGTVVKKENHHFHVADAGGRVFGKFRHKDLLKIADYSKGQMVELTRSPLEVEGYEPQSGTYILSDPQSGGSRKFFAEAPLLSPVSPAVEHAAALH